MDLINQAIDLLKDFSIKIRTIASDGDHGYNIKTDETYEKYIHIFEENSFYAAVESIMRSNETFYISGSYI